MLQQMNGDPFRAAYRAFCPTRMVPTSGLRPSAESDLPGEDTAGKTLRAKTDKGWNAPLKGPARATCLDLKSLGVCVVRFGLSMFDYRLKLNPCRERRDR